MDHVNRFESKVTFQLLRAEYAVALVVCTALFFWNVREVNWYTAVFLFVYIDLIGYIPGAIAFRRARGGPISKTYYLLYNTMHSFVTHAVILGVWMAVSGPEWAMLAVPIHLCGDRAIFGNFLKSFRVPFEPVALPAFVDFDQRAVRQDRPKYPLPERV